MLREEFLILRYGDVLELLDKAKDYPELVCKLEDYSEKGIDVCAVKVFVSD